MLLELRACLAGQGGETPGRAERGETVEMKLLKNWSEKSEPKKTKKKKIVRKEDIHFIDTSLV